jgi:2-oxoglutarate ferredoxin oxidoreductase subunit delta
VPKVVIDEIRCKGCALCTIACPFGLIRLSEKLNKQGYFPAEISPEALLRCTSCAMCAQMCPDVAITVYREVKDSDK